MYRTNSNKSFCASANSAAASFACANLFVMDAVLLASILFCLTVLPLGILCVLVVLVSILRISLNKTNKTERLA